MPRYFFDLSDDRLHRDEAGRDLPDAEAARLTAIRTLFDAALVAAERDEDPAYIVTVRDEASRRIYSASMVLQGVWFDSSIVP